MFSQNPSVSKSNRLHVVNCHFPLLIWGIFYRFLLNFCKVLTSNSTGSSVSTGQFQWSQRLLGITTGWDPSVCTSNRLHVDILRFSFIWLGYILQIPPKWPVTFLQSWTSTVYFSNYTGSSVTNCRFSTIIGSVLLVHCWPADEWEMLQVNICFCLTIDLQQQ